MSLATNYRREKEKTGSFIFIRSSMSKKQDTARRGYAVLYRRHESVWNNVMFALHLAVAFIFIYIFS